jgi:hypothetical protein
MIDKSLVIENTRFSVDKPSIEAMNRFIDGCNRLSLEIPEIGGVGFFGSRTVEQNSPEADLDATIFYDGTALAAEEPYFLQGDPPRKCYKQNFDYDKRKALLAQQKAFEDNLIEKGSKLLATVLPIPQENHTQVNIIDISQQATLSAIEDFRQELHRHQQTQKDTSQISKDDITLVTAAAPLYLRFSLCVGSKIDENRKFILDTLEKDPEGESMFLSLMTILKYSERIFAKEKHPDLPIYEKYPKSINEAREYFSQK